MTTAAENARCELTDLLVTDCAHCRPKVKQATWPARYEGVCRHPGCPNPVIDVGDRVTWTDDGELVQHAVHVR